MKAKDVMFFTRILGQSKHEYTNSQYHELNEDQYQEPIEDPYHEPIENQGHEPSRTKTLNHQAVTHQTSSSMTQMATGTMAPQPKQDQSAATPIANGRFSHGVVTGPSGLPIKPAVLGAGCLVYDSR
ncbi:hypothetical protein BGX34_003648 [Mortierella sp. NVP85]|nr:hypothetical protein BGX34_003648 [Mortierella sp. NVP85]